MGQERFSSLGLVAIEREVCEQLNFTSLIDKFASKKVRKIRFN